MPSADVATSAFTSLFRSASSASFRSASSSRPVALPDLVPGVPEQRGRLLRSGDGERVDDAAARQVADVRRQPGEPRAVRRQAQHAEPQRVAGQQAADRRHLDAACTELLGDVVDEPRSFAVAVVASTGVPAGRVPSRSRMRR